eukprot:gnl/TRDRNA2_/TRDRNA2_144394_c0_seq2.p1 gnl/TRDRNA2_/TRDRNA2_144394_c0~~gnl/TRDRNA2_/TRDRNA2_144394_c0_seq2.p1  ORF type:complete len:186 (-),score=12.09 gnl/TRDRNA2_/TRDRNA2_144394_c0_seq2:573-1130(-)
MATGVSAIRCVAVAIGVGVLVLFSLFVLLSECAYVDSKWKRGMESVSKNTMHDSAEHSAAVGETPNDTRPGLCANSSYGSAHRHCTSTSMMRGVASLSSPGCAAAAPLYMAEPKVDWLLTALPRVRVAANACAEWELLYVGAVPKAGSAWLASELIPHLVPWNVKQRGVVPEHRHHPEPASTLNK